LRLNGEIGWLVSARFWRAAVGEVVAQMALKRTAPTDSGRVKGPGLGFIATVGSPDSEVF